MENEINLAMATSDHNSKLLELFNKEEPLCEELRSYIHKGELGEMIHHPLIIEIFFDPKRCALINYRLQLKKEELAEAKASKKWISYVFAHERPYRAMALCETQRLGCNDLKLIKSVWVDSENIQQNNSLWKLIWLTIPNPREIMDPNEKTVYSMMPEKIEIHRGIRHRTWNRRGLSWTRDKERASFFASRWPTKERKPVVLSTVIKKEKIAAYINVRGEEEVVILPRNLPKKITEYSIG